MRLETIQAAGFYTKIVRNYYETITKEDNLLKKVATPKKDTTNNKMLNNAYYDCQKTGSYNSNAYIRYTFKLLELSWFDFLKSLFPNTQGDLSNPTIEKPFLLENKGGEFIETNSSINTLNITNVSFNTLQELPIDSVTTTEETRDFKTVTKYKYISPVDYFPNYDINKNLRQNLEDGVFENLFTVTTENINISYTKDLQDGAWVDGSKSVRYSPYAVLNPSNASVKYNVEYTIQGDYSVLVTKTEYTTKETTPATCSIIY